MKKGDVQPASSRIAKVGSAGWNFSFGEECPGCATFAATHTPRLEGLVNVFDCLNMKSYPAKILLFGEHTVNLGTPALAMPLAAFRSKWVQPNLPKEEILKKQRQLPRLAEWLAAEKEKLPFALDVAGFRNALDAGWVLESNVPEGYGLGSSGAVVAAIVDRWGAHLPKDLPTLRRGLALIEAFFHGKSSGTDPLVSFLGQPVRIAEADVSTIALPPLNDSGLFILDTGIARTATPLISRFLEAWNNPEFEKRCSAELLPSVNEAIGHMTCGAWARLFEAFRAISQFQLENTPWLIPEEFRPLWEELLHQQRAALKICGAGGGGFLLGMLRPGAPLPEATKKWPVKFLEELA